MSKSDKTKQINKKMQMRLYRCHESPLGLLPYASTELKDNNNDLSRCFGLMSTRHTS